jgi:hypothetical protein
VGGVTALGGDGNLANRSNPLPVTNDGETGGDPTLVRVSVAHSPFGVREADSPMFH